MFGNIFKLLRRPTQQINLITLLEASRKSKIHCEALKQEKCRRNQ